MESDRERDRGQDQKSPWFPTIREEIEGNYKAEKIPADNKQGYRMEYSYIGDYFAPNDDALKLKKAKIRIGILCVACVLLYFCAVLQKSYVSADRIVFGGSLLSAVLLLFEVSGVIQLLLRKDVLTSRALMDLSFQLKIMPLFHGGLLLLCAFSAAAAAVRGSGGAAAYLTAACYAFSGISSILIFLQYRKLGYTWIPTSPFE